MPASIADTITGRRTIHHFTPGKVPPRELLEQALASSLWAPNHRLSQPWRFHLLGDKTVEQICQLNVELVTEKNGAKAAEIKMRRWRDVPGWLVLSTEKSADKMKSREDYAACCCVAQNLSLLLWEQGIGMKWTTGGVTRDRRFFQLLGLEPEKHDIVGLFWYGYPAEIPQATRLPLHDCLSILP